MKKHFIQAAIGIGLFAFNMNSALAGGGQNCFVLGVKEPNTNTYNGPTFCGAIKLSDITVRGPLQLNKTTINGTTRVSGPIQASGASLQNVVLENNHSLEKVYLQSSTVVNGDIIFEGKKGVVYLEGGTSIKGKVLNGNITYK